MKCLIDADILAYEIASAGAYKDEETGETVIRPFQPVADLFDQRIKEIEGECWATEPSTLYLTGDKKLLVSINRRRKHEGLPPFEFKENFRKEIAKTKEYKGTRKSEKPFHFDNLREYMLANYDVVIAQGLEADDLISIELTKVGDKLDVICCTRDKDLRMVPGMHYGWPCGAQPQYGPKRVTELGELFYNEDKNKLTGDGFLFFCAQMIIGDKVDNIPGLPGAGDKKAWQLLGECTSMIESEEVVRSAYREKVEGEWLDYYVEQEQLLWMLRELPEGLDYDIQSNKVLDEVLQ